MFVCVRVRGRGNGGKRKNSVDIYDVENTSSPRTYHIKIARRAVSKNNKK